MTSIIYVGMDVHTTNYTLCCYSMEDDRFFAEVQVEPDVKSILKYLARIEKQQNKECRIVCGYEAGCLGYSLYHQLHAHGVDCVILAPSTMMTTPGKRIKTDRRDARLIGCLPRLCRNCVPVFFLQTIKNRPRCCNTESGHEGRNFDQSSALSLYQNGRKNQVNCRKCRAEIPDGSKFCLMCGVRQQIAQRTKSRGNGQGSVYQLPNKRWIAVKTIGYEPSESGTLRRVTRSKSGFRTKKEALDYLPQISGERRAKSVTFQQLYDMWEPTHRAGKSTMDCYHAAFRYFKPIYHVSLRDITIDDLQECMDDCQKGKRTRENMKALCGLLYKYAIPRKLTDINMGQYLIVGGGESGSKEALPEEALEALEDAVGIVAGADYVLCQCYLGFRPSEFLALDAANYDRVEKAFVGGAKTDAGRDRVVTVSPKIQPLVDRLTRDKIAGPVFCASGGGKMDLKAYRAMFYRVLEQCGIGNPVEKIGGVERRKYTPHSCRHTFATLMKRVSGSDKDKLELMGHTSAEMLRHYQCVTLSDLRKITDAI